MASRLDALVKSIVFPRPKPATFDASTHLDVLLHIPCVDRDTLLENGLFTNGYLFRHPAATHLLLYAHPNAVDIGMLYEEMRHLCHHARIDVLVFEYSGYGLTHREITEASIHDDMHSAYWFARHYLGVPSNRLVVCGRSLGAAPAAKLCATRPPEEEPSLLILQCPFTALSECIQEFSHNAVTIANFLGYDWFRTVDLIARVRCPVVLHHGTHDTIVPISHSYALRERRDRAARPCVTYMYQEDGKGHNNLSRSLLIQIIRDKVDTEGLSPLNVPWPASLVAHVPLHPRLFPADCRKQPLRLRHQQWQASYSLAPFLTSGESLYALLTASVSSFAMKVAYAWQVYSEVVKRNARNASTSSSSHPRHHQVAASNGASNRAMAGSSSSTSDIGGSHPGNYSFSRTSGNTSSKAGVSNGSAAAKRMQQGETSVPLEGFRSAGGGRRSGGGGGGVGGEVRCSKDDFIERCVACWGSPLGIHVPVAGVSHGVDVLIFGAHVPPGKCASFDIGWHFSTRPTPPMVTVAELPMSPGLLQAIRRVVSAAPELLVEPLHAEEARRRRRQALPISASTTADNSTGTRTPLNHSLRSGSAHHAASDRDCVEPSSLRDSSSDDEGAVPRSGAAAARAALPAFIHPDHVTAIQTECERIVGVLSEDDATRLHMLLKDFDKGCAQQLSPQCGVITSSSFEEESFDELEEWLRPYEEQPHLMESIAAEVPWDYYLFKARVLADRRRLAVDMDWPLCLRAAEEARIVVSVYRLFRKHYLPRSHVPDDA